MKRAGKGVEQWGEGRGEGRFGREQRERGKRGELLGRRQVREIQDKGKNAAAGEKRHRGRETGRRRGTDTPKRWKMIETEQDRAKGD